RRRGHGWRARHREVHEGDASHRHKHGKTDEGEHECDAAGECDETPPESVCGYCVKLESLVWLRSFSTSSSSTRPVTASHVIAAKSSPFLSPCLASVFACRSIAYAPVQRPLSRSCVRRRIACNPAARI